MKEAGIIVWVLTGDKIETAINIGHSCGLLHKNMVEIVLDDTTNQNLLVTLENALKALNTKNRDTESSLIISGHVLALILA